MSRIERLNDLAYAGPPAGKWLFEVQLPYDLDFGDVSSRVLSIDIGGYKLPTTAGFPFFSNLEISLPESMETGDVTILFWEDEKGTVTHFLEKWAELMYDKETGDFKPPANYWRNIWVRLLKGDKSPWRSLKIINCYPTTWYEYNLSYEDGSYLGIQVSIQHSGIQSSWY